MIFSEGEKIDMISKQRDAVAGLVGRAGSVCGHLWAGYPAMFDSPTLNFRRFHALSAEIQRLPTDLGEGVCHLVVPAGQ